jgi:hypothetical protein
MSLLQEPALSTKFKQRMDKENNFATLDKEDLPQWK